MKAWAFSRYKDEIQLIDVAEPSVGAQDVLIGVKAVGLNHVDDMVRRGEFKALMKFTLPMVLGQELAGEVIAVGDAVTGFKTGDRVYSRPSTNTSGTLTSVVAVNQSEVAAMPNGLAFAEAAAVPLAGLTAWQALVDLGKVGPRSTVLIHGGAGGVGIFAVQLAKFLGAHVVATSGSADMDFVRNLGADEVIDYRTAGLNEFIGRFDIVLDNVGEASVVKSLPLVKKGGLVIGITGPADAPFAQSRGANGFVTFIVRSLGRKVTLAAAKLGVNYRFLFMEPNGAELSEITALINQGAIKPFVSKSYGFNQARIALEDLVNGRVRRGKAIVEVGAN